MTQEFSNLKSKLKDHLQTKFHKFEKLKADEEMAKKKQDEPRKITVGMNIMRMVYKMIKNNEADTHFEDDLLVAYQNGVDIGDLNHSRKLVPKIMPYIAEDIRKHIILFLSHPLKQTTYLPTGKVLADSSTTNHRPREFVAFLTVIPDGEELIKAIHLPIILQKDGSTGQSQKTAICEALKIGTEHIVIKSEQYLGTSGDGHFQHCNVHRYMDEEFGVSRHHEYDPMHKAGRQDVHIRQDDSFKWLANITKVIGGAFKFVNLREEFMDFFEICQNIIDNPAYPESKFYEIVFFKECRFANSTSRVYNAAFQEYSGLVEKLEKAIMVRSQKPNAKDQEIARKASNIANILHTVRSAARISGLSDIYDVVAKAIVILQKVNLLPYERMDQYLNVIKQLNAMTECVNDHNLCPKKDDTDDIDCVWPKLHSQLPDLHQGKFMNKTLAAQVEEENRTRSGLRKKENAKNQNQVTEAIKDVKNLAKEMHSKLNDNVYNSAEKEFIEKIRTLTDLRSLTKKCKSTSVNTVYADTVNAFVDNAKLLTPHGKDLSVNTLQTQYKLLLQKIVDVNNDSELVLNSKNIIMCLLNSETKLYTGIEKVMYVITTAAVLNGIESIIESHISIFNDRVSGRDITEERAVNEVMIKINGPDLAENEKLLKRSVENSKDSWHFVRQERNVKTWIVSKVIQRKLGQRSALPFTV